MAVSMENKRVCLLVVLMVSVTAECSVVLKAVLKDKRWVGQWVGRRERSLADSSVPTKVVKKGDLSAETKGLSKAVALEMQRAVWWDLRGAEKMEKKRAARTARRKAR